MDRNVSTAARGSGERRFSSSGPGQARAMPTSARTAATVGRGCRSRGAAAAARSSTRRRKTGSEVYWAMPLPSANGRCPRSRSRGRQPSIVVSRVTTSASQPAASARPKRLSTSSSDVDQYSWNQRGESPMAAAQVSIDTDAWLENTRGTPSPAAARATARSASGCTSSSAPTGPSSTGAGSRRPNSSTELSRSLTSRSTRGTTDHRSKAARLARWVVSLPAPPAT